MKGVKVQKGFKKGSMTPLKDKGSSSPYIKGMNPLTPDPYTENTFKSSKWK